jgi:hypothetical protein
VNDQGAVLPNAIPTELQELQHLVLGQVIELLLAHDGVERVRRAIQKGEGLGGDAVQITAPSMLDLLGKGVDAEDVGKNFLP